MKDPLYRLLVVSALVAGLGACSTLHEQRRSDLLDSSLRGYEKAIRWSEFEVANTFRKDGDKSEPVPDFQALRDIRVTSYDVTTRDVDEDKTEARQSVRIGYYNVNYLREKTLTDKQHWLFDEEAKRWYLDGSLPVFEAD
jgi:hypothetical protein